VGDKSANGADLREYKDMLGLIASRIGATSAPDATAAEEEDDDE